MSSHDYLYDEPALPAPPFNPSLFAQTLIKTQFAFLLDTDATSASSLAIDLLKDVQTKTK